ncbi:DUF4913 domain-containing protein [Kribbella sp. NPDC056951]|uniref:DUF4913 domain-containing protein n=1 Tax=Kribbella sp. NPDC056951 TaxID=3345978 RepID=UPI0036454AEB
MDGDLDAEDVKALRMAMQGLQGSGWQPPAQAAEFRPQFADLESWVNGFFVLTFARTADQRWCAAWWDHAEAMLRLEALWRTWEVAALDPVRGMAGWIREHLDPNLSVLFGANGPFAACTPEQHVRPQVLPVTPPPDGWWSSSHQHWWDVLGEADW